MHMKRFLFVIALLVFSFVCFNLMNDSYDRFARYQYEMTSEQRESMDAHLSDDDISYIIQQKIKPEQIMKYIALQGFDVRKTLYYETCATFRPADLQFIVHFVNTYRSFFTFADLEALLINYDYQMLSEFYDGLYPYLEKAKLVNDPSVYPLDLDDHESFYKYRPTQLVNVDVLDIPAISRFAPEVTQVKEAVVKPLENLCKGLQEQFTKTCGGLVLSSGYVSYENQIKLYDEAIVKFGIDNVSKYEDKPGRSERQLGYMVQFLLSEVAVDQYAESEQAIWLLENADQFGFEVAYPKDKEEDSGKIYQPFTLRYVGSTEKTRGELEQSE